MCEKRPAIKAHFGKKKKKGGGGATPHLIRSLFTWTGMLGNAGL